MPSFQSRRLMQVQQRKSPPFNSIPTLMMYRTRYNIQIFSEPHAEALGMGAISTHISTMARTALVESGEQPACNATGSLREHEESSTFEVESWESIVHLNIWRELVILDTHLHALNTGLQELPRLQTDPNLGHGQVARPEHTSSTLCTELTQDWESTDVDVS